MKTPRSRGIMLAGIALALSAGPVAAQQRSPGLAPTPDSVEGGLWGASDAAERGARSSAERNADPVLNAYVKEIACTVAPEYCGEVRIYVMDRPVFNATASPNGYIEVWSGLLLRAGSEAGVAFALGHEVGHYAENHSLEQWRSTKGWATAAMVVTLGAGVAGAYYQVDLSGIGDLAYMTAISSIFTYGRGQEEEADRLGLQRMRTAGYDPRAASELWESLRADRQVSSFPSVRRAEAWPGVFRTHPLTIERIVALREQAGDDGGRLEHDRYRSAIRPHLARWLDDELNRRDFGSTLAVIDRLDVEDQDAGVLNYYRGQAYRQRRDPGDELRARDAYRLAVVHADAPAAAWRELGDLESRTGDAAAARAAWARYLDAAPDADDRWIVEDSLAHLAKDAR